MRDAEGLRHSAEQARRLGGDRRMVVITPELADTLADLVDAFEDALGAALARLDAEHAHGQTDTRQPLAQGDRLVSNPCDVWVTEVTGSALARGRCRICRTDHVLDRAMFDAGHGPWQRLGEETDG